MKSLPSLLIALTVLVMALGTSTAVAQVPPVTTSGIDGTYDLSYGDGTPFAGFTAYCIIRTENGITGVESYIVVNGEATYLPAQDAIIEPIAGTPNYQFYNTLNTGIMTPVAGAPGAYLNTVVSGPNMGNQRLLAKR